MACARAHSSLCISAAPWFSSFSQQLKFHTDCFFPWPPRCLPMNKFWCHYHFNRSISLKFGDVCKQKICSSGVCTGRTFHCSRRHVTRLQRGLKPLSLSLLCSRNTTSLFASFLVFVSENKMIRCGSTKEWESASRMLEMLLLLHAAIFISIMRHWQNNICRKWNADGVGRATVINLSGFCILSDRAKRIPPAEANGKQSEW